MISVDDSVRRPGRETSLRRTSVVTSSRRRTRTYSLYELVLASKGCFNDEYQDGPPGSVTWKMGDRRNDRTYWGQCRDMCGALVNSRWFQRMVNALIIVNAILMGVMTFDFVTMNPVLSKQFGTCDLAILIVFTIDFILQLTYLGWMLLSDNWFIFDGVLVISSWAFMGTWIKAFRTLRIVRVFALISRLESLRTVLTAVWNSIPAMGSIWMILGMFFYVFAILFTNLYSKLYNEGYGEHNYFGRLDLTLFTLFQLMTMDNWSNVTREIVDARPWAFVLLNIYISFTGVVIVNLMIAVVCQSLSDMKESSNDGVQGQEVDSADAGNDATGFAEGLYDQPADIKTEASRLVATLSGQMRSTADSTLADTHEDWLRSLAIIRDEVKKTQAEIREILQAILERLPPT